MVSEAGHYKLFMDLAKLYNFNTLERWNDFLNFENISQNIDLRGDRMH